MNQNYFSLAITTQQKAQTRVGGVRQARAIVQRKGDAREMSLAIGSYMLTLTKKGITLLFIY